jgi:enoyl-CoA hydratase/carnithine racemase
VSDYEHILYQKRGHVAYVTLNRPQVMNALHPPAHRELAAAWADGRLSGRRQPVGGHPHRRRRACLFGGL